MAARRTLTFLEVVGRGGFGTVYRATLEAGAGFRKDVAVKVLHEGAEASAQIAERLRDEARLLGLVRHRALPSVDGLYWVGGRCALVTEYVHGVSLLAATKNAPLPLGVVLEIGAEVASALHAAYTAPGPDGQPLKLVHRDVKPANIQLTPAGEVKLLDFGIARADFVGREAETSQVLLGSVTYMAPERLDLESGPGSDVYALGVTLAEAVTALKMPRTSANPERHATHVDHVVTRVRAKLEGTPVQTVPDSDGATPMGTSRMEWAVEAFLELLGSMLAYEADDRPTARDVDRRLREIRRRAPLPLLPEWAEDRVRPDERSPMDDKSGGATLIGQAVEVSDEPARPPAAVVARQRRLWWSGIGVAVVLGMGAILAGGVAVALAATALWPDGTDVAVEPPPDPDAVPDPDPDPEPEPEPEVPPPPPDPVPEGTADVVPVPVVPTPTPVVTTKVDPKPPTPPEPEGTPEAPAPAAARPVSASAFAGWLASHPDWAPAAAMADGRADAQYLRGWSGGNPPASPAWALDVTWAAAAAYCSEHGGLASIAAEPLSWSEDSGPIQEWRSANGKAAWLRYDGATSTVVRRSEANGFTGFRCAR